MKKTLLLSLFLLYSCSTVITNSPTSSTTPQPSAISSETPVPSVSVSPKVIDISDYIQRYQANAVKPEEVVKIWFEGLYKYISGDQDKGSAILALVMADSDWQNSSSQIFFRDRLKNKQYIFKSYNKGATPENSYSSDLSKTELEITKVEQQDNGYKIFVRK